MRAIYVGKDEDYVSDDFSTEAFLRYGMTGTAWLPGPGEGVIFYPDSPQGGWGLQRHKVYIPSLDQQRHCPKP